MSPRQVVITAAAAAALMFSTNVRAESADSLHSSGSSAAIKHDEDGADKHASGGINSATKSARCWAHAGAAKTGMHEAATSDARRR